MINLDIILKINHITSRLILLGIGTLLFACKDEMTDPNDTKYNSSEGDAIIIQLNNYHQTMNHFGASDAWSAEWVGRWPNASKEPLAKLLFSKEVDSEGNPKGIALSMWRFNFGEGAGEQTNSGYAADAWKRETECFLNPDGTYDWNKQVGARWFLQKAREYGVPYFTGWTNSPPYFMTKNGLTFNTDAVGNKYNLAASNYEKFATHLAKVTKHFEEEGFPFVAVSPFNEPQHAWRFNIGAASQSGSYATNAEISAITRIINKKFEDLGVNSKIMLSEAGSIDALYTSKQDAATSNQINTFFNLGSINYLGNLSKVSKHIAGHSYWLNPNVSTSISHRKNLLAKMQQINNELEYWQTEYSLLGTDYRGGKDWQELKDMDFALWLARIIHIDVTQANCSGWSFWTAMNNSNWQDHANRFGLIRWIPNIDAPTQSDGTYEVCKNLWAMGNFSRFIRPGMRRIDVLDAKYSNPVDAASNFMISAYRDLENNKLVLVMINYTGNRRQIKIDNYLKDFKLKDNKFNVYTTSETSDLKKSVMTVDGISIPEKSITTLVGEMK